MLSKVGYIDVFSHFNLFSIFPSRVLFFSIHRYEEGKFWPHLRDGNFDCVGKGSGKGFNFNIPLNKTGLTNEDYLAIFQQIIIPVSYEVRNIKVLIEFFY